MTPNSHPSACIYVCQSAGCRSEGSDAVLVEIQELAKIAGNCDVKPTRCYQKCTKSGPVVAVKRYGHRTKIYLKINTFHKSAAIVRGLLPSNANANANENYNSTNGGATSRNNDSNRTGMHCLPLLTTKNLLAGGGAAAAVASNSSLSLSSSKSRTTRLSELHEAQVRRHYVSTYQWNKALSGLNERLIQKQGTSMEDTELILRKAGYPGTRPKDWFLGPPATRRTVPTDNTGGGSRSRDTRRQQYQEQQQCSRFLRRSSVIQMMPKDIDGYALWTLKDVQIVSSYSALFNFVTNDPKRGTPHPRGARKIVTPITWHVTMLGEIGANTEGPLPWIERHYSPISSAAEWEAGKCTFLIKIYNTGQLTSWLQKRTRSKLMMPSSNTQQQPQPQPTSIIKYGETKIWLSKPIKTLNVPSLTTDDDDGNGYHDDDDDDNDNDNNDDGNDTISATAMRSLELPRYPSLVSQQPLSSVLLLLAGTGIVALPQIMAHRYDPMQMLGISKHTLTQSSQLTCPIDVIHSCYDDDIVLLPQIQQYCIDGMDLTTQPHRNRGIRNYTLLTQRSTIRDQHRRIQQQQQYKSFVDGDDINSNRNNSPDQQQQEKDDVNTTLLPPFRRDFNNHVANDTILRNMYYANIMESQCLDKHIVATAIHRINNNNNTAAGNAINSNSNYRVIVSGPKSFNKEAKQLLLDCNVPLSQVTILAA